MSQQPPPAPKPGATPPPPKPGAPPNKGHTGNDKLETNERNIFGGGRKYEFQPTPLKPQTTAEISTPGMRVPVRIGSGGSGRGPAVAPATPTPAAAPAKPAAKPAAAPERPAPAQQSTRNSAAFMMPGMPTPGQEVSTPGKKKPINPAQGSSAVAARPMQKSTNPSMPAAAPKPAGKPAPKAPAAQSQGLITSGDNLQYPGKLPVFVGKAVDGNPMIDAEDTKFVFDPVGKRIQIQCKVASIMLKAACLHLGIPAPDRGPRRFLLTALVKPDMVAKHHAQLFDGNLEVRLAAQEEGRPVLLDLTLYETFNVHPDG